MYTTNYIQKTNLWVPILLQNGTILNLGQSLFITNKTKTNVIETILIILKKKIKSMCKYVNTELLKLLLYYAQQLLKQKKQKFNHVMY